jgi:SAM-dependent methyltransferase
MRNRQDDYVPLTKDRTLLALHLEMNRQLLAQAEEWDDYDYGEGYFYQSSKALGISGLRDTDARVAAFGLPELLAGRTVLEIGCNTGFLGLAIAPICDRVFGFELNPYLIAIAEAATTYLGITNMDVEVSSFEDLAPDATFDDVLSFANHHTYDENQREPLDDYFERCHAFTRPGGRLIFESHPPELEGDIEPTLVSIEKFFTIEHREVPDYGTFLDKDRTLVIATRS